MKASLQIGTIYLREFEVPESVRFGGSQRVAVHKLADCKRIVEPLGPDDEDIRFRGIFTGPTAQARVRSFDNLRLSGETVWLTWASFRCRVIVKKLIAELHNPFWIAYEATCIAVHQTTATIPFSGSVSSQISSDLANASVYGSGPDISLTLLQTTLAAPNALTANTSDQAQAIAASQVALGTCTEQISQLSTALSNPLRLSNSPYETGDAYCATVEIAGVLASAANAKSYIGRIATNLSKLGV